MRRRADNTRPKIETEADYPCEDHKMIPPRAETPPLADGRSAGNLPSANQRPDFNKKAEAHLLTDEFGIAPIDAAAMLVTAHTMTPLVMRPPKPDSPQLGGGN